MRINYGWGLSSVSSINSEGEERREGGRKEERGEEGGREGKEGRKEGRRERERERGREGGRSGNCLSSPVVYSPSKCHPHTEPAVLVYPCH